MRTVHSLNASRRCWRSMRCLCRLRCRLWALLLMASEAQSTTSSAMSGASTATATKPAYNTRGLLVITLVSCAGRHVVHLRGAQVNHTFSSSDEPS
jgi:hypothetical protein